MEKPSGRSSSSNSKGPNSETKAKQESNKHSRTPKYKENVYSRPEQTRRPTPQRSRIAYDKRPRSRGGFGADRDRSEVTLTEKFGSAAAVKLGNKKLSLNHLLNFTISPPTSSLSNEYRGGSWQTGRSHRKQKLPKYNKEQFLQANCQFVVKEDGDYSIHTTDPDILVDWELVEEILLPSHEVPSCPICLYPPTAAKITRCGHIYCWSCLLHYLALSDKSWRKCPICYEAIHKSDLKSVVSTFKTAYQVGDEITMCLMKRKRDSVIARPVYQANLDSSNTPLSLDDDANSFQKLLIASIHDVKTIIQREYNELKTQLESESDLPESCFLQSALEFLQERKQLLFEGKLPENDMFEMLTINEKSDNSEYGENCNNLEEDNLISDNAYCQVVEYMTDPFSDEDNELLLFSSPDNNNEVSIDMAKIMDTSHTLDETDIASSVSDDVPKIPEPSLPSTVNSSQAPPKRNQRKEFYYFYQAIDGQNIYLHNINVQMLEREFGSLEHCPHKFTAKVVELEGESMNLDLRKRLRYLRHLPLTCEFQIAELGLHSPLIHESTREAFKGQLEKRSRTRRRKANKEKRREQHIEQEENRKLGKFPGLNCHLDSLQHFPACSQPICGDDDPPLPSNSVNSSSSSDEPVLTGLSSSPGQASDKSSSEKADTQIAQPASFAQMLRQGKMKQMAPQLSSVDNKLVVGTPSSDEECSAAAAPAFRQSLGDAIEAALHNMNHSNAADEDKNPVRKKKGKKMVLFTTSVNRRK